MMISLPKSSRSGVLNSPTAGTSTSVTIQMMPPSCETTTLPGSELMAHSGSVMPVLHRLTPLFWAYTIHAVLHLEGLQLSTKALLFYRAAATGMVLGA